MKLRNKRTGEVVHVDFVYPDTAEYFYPGYKLEAIIEEWEDYDPKEPPIKDGLTTEEHEVLANYHINIIGNYLHEIDQNISFVNKNKLNIKFIENTLELIKRELKIVKFYKDRIEKADENKS